MPLQIVRNDITQMKVDAIVNAAKNSLRGGGGVDGCIHQKAGPGLLAECLTLGGCATGDAKITGAYDLPCRYVIHTVGPVYRGGKHGERDALISCYRRSLELAKQYDCERVAFPLISAGIFGYPKEEVFRIATETISEFLMDNDMTVYLVVFGRNSLEISRKLFRNIQRYIDDNYELSHVDDRYEEARCAPPSAPCCIRIEPMGLDEGTVLLECAPKAARRGHPLDGLVFDLDESFSQMLLRKIDEKHMTDAECYKRANIDRKLFSKIRNDANYKPKKTTVLAFAIALELSFSETEDFLKKAGFALSHSNKFDIIIEYCLRNRIYNIYEVNEALFSFDQVLLGE